MFKYLSYVLFLAFALSACDKEREAARATGDVPKEIITYTTNAVNESMQKAEQSLNAATENAENGANSAQAAE